MDLLSSALKSLKVESLIISAWDMRGTWGIDIRDFYPGYLLNVQEGECWLLVDDQAPVKLLPGDSILALQGTDCRLVSSPGAPLSHLSEIWELDEFPGFEHYNSRTPVRINWGKGNRNTLLLGLAFQFQDIASRALLRSLPTCIVLRNGSDDPASPVKTAMNYLLTEAGDNRPGDLAINSHLAELIFITRLRNYILSERDRPTGWLKALSDPKIGNALAQLHAMPAHDWKIESLAKSAGMSRSLFYERFNRILGQSPVDYLNTVRVQMAAEFLRGTKRQISDIAEATGFNSDRAFRRFFKQRIGVSPQQYRSSDINRTAVSKIDGRHRN